MNTGSDNRLMKFEEVSRKVGLGRTAIYERIGKGRFPAPTKVGKASRWVSSEIDAWLAAGIESRVFFYASATQLLGRDESRRQLRLKDGKAGGKEDLQNAKRP